MAHQAGKRVLVNQFYRIEVLRDVDGVCHENDYLPGLGYLSPLRPMAAWHLQAGYKGDLTAFQAHLKQRLHWALQPQMIAHQFPISQQPPNPRAADLLESYAPLFARLVGARQVLLPHCVSATGEGDVNLFRNSAGQYIVPVSSPRPPAQPVTVTLDVPDGHRVTWAEVISAGGKTAPAKIVRSGGSVQVRVGLDASAAVLVLGRVSQRTKGI